jgi:hypothetical protein
MLPEEVLEYILSYAILSPPTRSERKSTSNRRCSPLLVSRQFYRLAQPILFQKLVIYSKMANNAIVSVLGRNPTLAKRVRSVRVTLPEGIEAVVVLARLFASRSQREGSTPSDTHANTHSTKSPSASATAKLSSSSPSPSPRIILDKLDIILSSHPDSGETMTVQSLFSNIEPFRALINALKTWPDTRQLVVRQDGLASHFLAEHRRHGTCPAGALLMDKLHWDLLPGSLSNVIEMSLAIGIQGWPSLVRPPFSIRLSPSLSLFPRLFYHSKNGSRLILLNKKQTESSLLYERFSTAPMQNFLEALACAPSLRVLRTGKPTPTTPDALSKLGESESLERVELHAGVEDGYFIGMSDEDDDDDEDDDKGKKPVGRGDVPVNMNAVEGTTNGGDVSMNVSTYHQMDDSAGIVWFLENERFRSRLARLAKLKALAKLEALVQKGNEAIRYDTMRYGSRVSRRAVT